VASPPADLNTIENPTAGQPHTAAWGDHVRTWVEFLASPPRCSVSHSTTQSQSSGTTLNALNADTESIDTDSMHSTSVNTSRITINTDGDYLLGTVVSYAANGTGNRAVAFRVNGTTDYLVDIRTGTATNSTGISGSLVLPLVTTDYVEVVTWQTSGGALNATLTQFSARWIGRT